MRIKLLIVLVLMLFLTACQATTTNNGQQVKDDLKVDSTSDSQEKVAEVVLSDEELILKVINLNLAAANSEDIDLYMSTLHRESLYYDSTREAMLGLFDLYELKYSLNDIEVVQIKGNEALIKLVQTTEKINGPEFNDNKAEINNIMMKQDGEWKIYNTEVNNVVYLNKSEVVEDVKLGTGDYNLADFLSVVVPLLDEENGNTPGQSMPNDTYLFLRDYPDLFPATDSSISKAINLIDTNIDYRNLTKSLNRYTSKMYYDSGYVIDIGEEYIVEMSSYFSHLHISNEFGEEYELLYPGSLEDVFSGDYVEFIGVPSIYSTFQNVSGGYTNVIVIIASHVELSDY